jgi:hypothetical protein
MRKMPAEAEDWRWMDDFAQGVHHGWKEDIWFDNAGWR